MERKFYTNDFEQLLRENADQFKMAPSKKVWHGIYNDIHPGRRWPSIPMSLLFVFTLVLVGHLNTQQSRHAYLTKTNKNIELKNPSYQNKSNGFAAQSSNEISGKNTNLKSEVTLADNNEFNKQLSGSRDDLIAVATNSISSTKEEIPGEKTSVIAETGSGNLFINNNNPLNSPNTIVAQFIPDESNLTTKADAIAPLHSINKHFIVTPSEQINNISSESLRNSNTVDKNPSLANDQLINKTPAVAHIKIHKNPKVNWTYYVSPAISFRSYSKQGNSEDQAFLGYITSSFANTSFNRSVTHHPSIGLEAGTAMKYSLTKKLKFTSGFQVNYSAYTIEANNIHPIIATLILHNERTGVLYPSSSISYFGNGPGNVPESLHNYSLHLSLPVGLEYKLAGDNDVQLFFAGSIQPSLVVTNQAYILSTDKRNYITESSLNRRWNIGTNIGTFVSFNSNKFKWEIGPEVSYQLLSTYLNKYYVREHFINYGIRFGVSNIIK
ncbi:MAG: hypothetical protein ABIO55_09005 [Ginsengibacter sp.]